MGIRGWKWEKEKETLKVRMKKKGVKVRRRAGMTLKVDGAKVSG